VPEEAKPAPEFAVTSLPDAAGWCVLSPVMVRTTGLPVNLLDELTWSAPADDEGLFHAELHRTSQALARITNLDLFREALAWQSPNVFSILDSYARTAAEPGRNSKKRQRDYGLARYLARYCGKTETIGFFGPSGWASLTGAAGHIDQRPGDQLISRRHTVAEAWAVRKLAGKLAADPEIAPWLPVRRRSHHAVRDGALYLPRLAPSPLSELEQAVLDCCDGERPRLRVTEQVAAALDLDRELVEACITDLIRRRCLVAGANLPLLPSSAAVLDARIAAIGDEPTRQRAAAMVAPFLAALRDLGEAAGDAETVTKAQATLGSVFSELVGTDGQRRGGRMYAGRGVAYEDCLRDLDIDFGTDFLARVSAGMRGILIIAQWLTWQAAAAYEAHFQQSWSGRTQRLDLVWFEILGQFFGAKPKPMDAVLAEFQLRWRGLVAELYAASGGWEFDQAEFDAAAERLFPSPGHGWPGAAVHCPDLQLVARSPEAARAGDYDVILSEIHITWATPTGPIFEWSLAENNNDYPVSRFLRSRTGRAVLPVFPDTWPRNTGRVMPTLPMPGDICFAFEDVEGAPRNTIPITAIEVGVADGAVFVELPDESRLSFGEFFSHLLSTVVIDAWKSTATGSHTPRISVGRFTISRQTWRIDVAGESFTKPSREFELYRAVQRWRRSLGLPDRVYVKLPGEVKPLYLDFDSPVLVLSFLAVVRSALTKPNSPTEIVVSEALPEPNKAWVDGQAGNRYLGEIRLLLFRDEPRDAAKSGHHRSGIDTA
jgi:hypothetical protein